MWRTRDLEQHNIDGGGADGSPSYPFYPSTEHFCKPAQGKSDFIDCVNLDGWTMDLSVPAVADRPDMVSMDITAVEVSARSRRTKVGGLIWGIVR